MARHILNTGVFVSWISWLERLILISACVFFAYKAYQNQPKLTSTLLYQTDDGAINITCDPSSDAAKTVLKQISRDLAEVLFQWKQGSGNIATYKYDYQKFKKYLKPDSQAARFLYQHVLKNVGSAGSKGPVELSASVATINFNSGRDWTTKKFKDENRWAISTTITQTMTAKQSTPDVIKWELFTTLTEGDANALYHIDTINLNRAN